MARYVRVDNLTRGTTLATRCRVASSMIDRTIGLLGSRGLAAGEGLYLERSPSIHMFFMRFPIDVVFVGADGRVARMDAGLRPWHVVAWARGARDCVELPVGALGVSGTQVGDQVSLTEVAA